MATPSGSPQEGVLLRLSVPAAGDFRAIASDLAVKVAEYLGTSASDVGGVAPALERAAREVAAPDGDAQIEFVFRRAAGALLIEARSGGRVAEMRHALPA
jgi:hypothetical protein